MPNINNEDYLISIGFESNIEQLKKEMSTADFEKTMEQWAKYTKKYEESLLSMGDIGKKAFAKFISLPKDSANIFNTLKQALSDVGIQFNRVRSDAIEFRSELTPIIDNVMTLRKTGNITNELKLSDVGLKKYGNQPIESVIQDEAKLSQYGMFDKQMKEDLRENLLKSLKNATEISETQLKDIVNNFDSSFTNMKVLFDRNGNAISEYVEIQLDKWTKYKVGLQRVAVEVDGIQQKLVRFRDGGMLEINENKKQQDVSNQEARNKQEVLRIDKEIYGINKQIINARQKGDIAQEVSLKNERNKLEARKESIHYSDEEIKKINLQYIEQLKLYKAQLSSNSISKEQANSREKVLSINEKIRKTEIALAEANAKGNNVRADVLNKDLQKLQLLKRSIDYSDELTDSAEKKRKVDVEEHKLLLDNNATVKKQQEEKQKILSLDKQIHDTRIAIKKIDDGNNNSQVILLNNKLAQLQAERSTINYSDTETQDNERKLNDEYKTFSESLEKQKLENQNKKDKAEILSLDKHIHKVNLDIVDAESKQNNIRTNILKNTLDVLNAQRKSFSYSDEEIKNQELRYQEELKIHKAKVEENNIVNSVISKLKQIYDLEEQRNNLNQSKQYSKSQEKNIDSQINQLKKDIQPFVEMMSQYEHGMDDIQAGRAKDIKDINLSADAYNKLTKAVDEYNQKTKMSSAKRQDINMQQEIDKAIASLKEEYELRLKLRKLQQAKATGGEYENLKNRLIQLSETNAKYKESLKDVSEYTHRAEQAQEDYNGSLAEINNNVHRTGTAFGSLIQQIKATASNVVKYQIAWNVLDSADDVFYAAIDKIKELDKLMTDIGMVTGQTQSELVNLTDTYAQMAIELGSTTSAVMESSVEWLRQGKTVEETNELIRVSTMLSKIGMIEASQASELLTATLNGYELEAKDAMSVLDKLTAIDLAFATSTEEVATSLQYVSSIASSLGISLDHLIGLITIGSERTRLSAQTIGNAWKSILSRFTNIKLNKFIDSESGDALNNTEAVLNQFGIKLRESESEWRNMGDVINEVGQKWKTFTTVEKDAIATQIAGTYHRNTFVATMESYDKVLEATTVAQNASGTATEKYEIVMNSLEAKINQLTTTWEKMVNRLNQGDTFRTVVDSATGLVSFLDILVNDMHVVERLLGSVLPPLVTNFVADTVNKIAKLQPRMSLDKTLMHSGEASGLTGLFGSLKEMYSISSYEKSLKTLGYSYKIVNEDQKNFLRIIDDVNGSLVGNKIEITDTTKLVDALGQSIGQLPRKLSGIQKVSLALSKIGTVVGIASTAINIAMGIFSAVQYAAEEARRKTIESIRGISDEFQNFESEMTKLQGLRDKLNNSELSYKENIEVRQEFAEIQKNIIEQYGVETAAIDAHTEALKKEQNAINNRKNDYYNEVLNRITTGQVDSARRYAGIRNRDLEGIIPSRKAYDEETIEELKNAMREYDGLRFSIAKSFKSSNLQFKLSKKDIDIDDWKQELSDFSSYLKDWGQKTGTDVSLITDKIASKISSINTNDKIKENQELLNKYVEAKVFTEYQSQVSNIISAQEELNNAFSKGDIDAIGESVLNFNRIFLTALNSTDDKDIQAYVKNMVVETQRLIEEYTKKETLKISIKTQIDTNSLAQGIIDDLNTVSYDEWGDAQVAQIDRLRQALGLADIDTQTLIDTLIQLSYIDAPENLIDGVTEIAASMEDINSELDKLQGAYDAVSQAINEYNENGSVSVDSLQSLLNLEPQYLAMLLDEEGKLSINAKTLQKVAKARIYDLGERAKEKALDMAGQYKDESAALDELTASSDGFNKSLEERNDKRLEELATTNPEQYKIAKALFDEIDAYTKNAAENINTGLSSPSNDKRHSYKPNKRTSIDKELDTSNLYVERIKDLESGLEGINQEITETESKLEQSELLNNADDVVRYTNLLIEQKQKQHKIYEQILEDNAKLQEEIKATFAEFADISTTDTGIAEFEKNIKNQITQLENAKNKTESEPQQRSYDLQIQSLQIRLNKFKEYTESLNAAEEQERNIINSLNDLDNDLISSHIDKYDKMSAHLKEMYDNDLINAQDYYDEIASLTDEFFKNDEKYKEEYKQRLIELRELEKEIFNRRISTMEADLDALRQRGETIAEMLKEIRTLDGSGKTFWLFQDNNYNEQIESLKELSEAYAEAYSKRKELLRSNGLSDVDINMDEDLQDYFSNWNKYEAEIKDVEKQFYEDRLDIYDDYISERDFREDWSTGEEIEVLKQMIKFTDEYYADKKLSDKDYYEYRRDIIHRLIDAEKEQYQKQEDSLKEYQEGIEDFVKQVIDSIKEEKRLEKERHQEQMDDFKKEAEARKRALDDAEAKRKYEKGLKEKAKKVSDLEKKLAELRLDTSGKSGSLIKKTEEDLFKARDELEEYQAKHSVDKQKDAIDEEVRIFEEKQKNKIDVIDKYVSEENQIRKDAINMIEGDWDSLYNKLIVWNREYGTGVDTDIVNAWNLAYSALMQYGGAQGSVSTALDTIVSKIQRIKELQQSIPDMNLGIPNATPNLQQQIDSQYPMTPNHEIQSYSDMMIDKMKANSKAWWEANDDERIRLSNENQMLGQQLGLYYDSSSGAWYKDSKRTIRAFAKGGYIDKGGIVMVHDDEAVLNRQQSANILSRINLDSQSPSKKLFNLSNIKTPVDNVSPVGYGDIMPITVQGNLDRSVLPEIKDIANKVISMIGKPLMSKRDVRSYSL